MADDKDPKTPNQVMLVAELAKEASDRGADPSLLIGVLVERAVHTIARRIPKEQGRRRSS